MPKKKGFQLEDFEAAKTRFPDAIRKLILTVKQDRPIPRLAMYEIQGLCQLGILRLEVGDATARVLLKDDEIERLLRRGAEIYLPDEAANALFATRVQDLQSSPSAWPRQEEPVSGVRLKEDVDEMPPVLRSATVG